MGVSGGGGEGEFQEKKQNLHYHEYMRQDLALSVILSPMPVLLRAGQEDFCVSCPSFDRSS